MKTRLLATILCAVLPLILGKTVNNNKQGVFSRQTFLNEHHRFFQRLTEEEKIWMMQLAVLYDFDFVKPIYPEPEVPSIEQPEVPSIEQPEGPVVEDPERTFSKPLKMSGKRRISTDAFGSFPVEGEVPTSLLAMMLNGQVPQGWQMGFTRWLMQDYNMTKGDFQRFRSGGPLCAPSATSCPGFGDIGAECCPWG